MFTLACGPWVGAADPLIADDSTGAADESTTAQAAVDACADPIAWTQPGPGALASGFEECSDGLVHRTAAIACDPGGWTAGDCENPWDADGECLTDAECGDGRCLESNEPWAGCTCNDGCTADADCGAGEACFCDGPYSRCVEATCRTDLDCPTDTLCVLTQSVSACGSIRRSLACTSPADECRSDGDCDECAQCLAGYETLHRSCSYSTGLCSPCG